MKQPTGTISSIGTTVRDDWRVSLPPDKSKIFMQFARELECTYSMFSVSLNEAIELRDAGMQKKCWQVVDITPELCSKLTNPLISLIRALSDHSKYYGTIPNAAPLNPANFQGSRGQRSARMSGLLAYILLSQRSQFIHKLGTLQEMVEDLGKDFRANADELSAGIAMNPKILWRSVEAEHYDLNTCLRETIVMLKSFLVAVPQNQLLPFQKTALGYMQLLEQDPSGAPSFRHRRMARIAGE